MTQELPAELKRALATVARVPRVLIACDYDGTMAPIVANPDDARPLTESAAAMRELAALPSTIAALISGRALRDLATLSRMPAEVHLVGSHGSEFDTGFVHAIDDGAKALLRKIKDTLGAIAAEYPGVAIEIKPASIALHVRNADPADADEAMKKAHAASQQWDAQITSGKAVLSKGNSITEGIGLGRSTPIVADVKVDEAYIVPDSEAVPCIFDLIEDEGSGAVAPVVGRR